jgi:hypothetical protein
MPIHDWTRVKAGIFHDFHHGWISEIKRTLHRGLLPPDHYALAEQLERADISFPLDEPRGGIALAEVQPKVSFRAKTEADIYAAKANRIAVRHVTDHRVVAVIEIVSPGNKSTRGAFRTFVEKASELLRSGVHLMVIDLFPPGPRDPQGIHKAIWDELDANDFVLPIDRPLTMASYIGGASQETFVEPAVVGGMLPDMPLFLSEHIYVKVPLDETYRRAWDAVPDFWRQALETSTPQSS